MAIAPRIFASKQHLRPLEFIRSEHSRQLELSEWLIGLAKAQQLDCLSGKAGALSLFLSEDLPMHHQDEEDSLFPLLRRRSEPEDRIEVILSVLEQDHNTERFLVSHILSSLRKISGGETIQKPLELFNDLRCFAEGQLEHLTWENQKVLPIAEKRLTKEDLLRISRNMALRRGIGYSI